MRPIPYPKEVYRHFKGKNYEIVALAKNAETEEDVVVYRAMYPPYILYTRTLENFLSETDHLKYPEATQQYRFEKTEMDPDASAQEISIVMPEIMLQDDSQKALLAFLDAPTYEKKLDVLMQMSETITDEMIAAMAVSLDLEINEGTVSEKFYTLKKCLTTMQKYEGIRLRE